jgi:hypothetical protein
MTSHDLPTNFRGVEMPVRQEAIIKAGILSRTTLHRLKKRGLRTNKIGRMVFIDVEELRRFLSGKKCG